MRDDEEVVVLVKKEGEEDGCNHADTVPRHDKTAISTKRIRHACCDDRRRIITTELAWILCAGVVRKKGTFPLVLAAGRNREKNEIVCPAEGQGGVFLF